VLSKRPLGAGSVKEVRRILESVLVILPTALLLFASGAQASHLHGGRSALRWGRFTPRALRTHEARLSHLAAVRPAIAGTASIEGTVRDAVKATGIAGVEVCAYASGPFEEAEEGEGAAPECSLSTVSGDYSITGLTAGEYIVEFLTPFNGTLDYITQYYPEAETFEGSLPVNVASGQRVSGIDAELSKGGEVEGHVTRALGGAPLAGIEVCAWGVNSEAMACAETDSGGAYLITGLPIGSFKVGFRAAPGSGLNYLTQYYENETSFEAAAPIAVKAEEKQEGINAAMALGAEIEGTVTSGATGAPSGDTLVCAFGEGEEVISCAVTAPSGNYTIAGLPTGSYTVAFLAEGRAEYYDQAFSESDATPVKVTAPEGDALNVDAVLPALPRKIVAPRVTGNATVGGILTCEEGSYSGVPAPTLSVEWLREGEAVAGATSATYTVQTADAGHQLQCKVTATNVMGWLWVKTAGIPIPVPPPATPPPATPPATPSSPTGGVLPSITVVPLVTAASRVLTSHHRTTVRLNCSGGPCKGTLHLLLRVVSHHHVTTLVLAEGSFSLQAGTGSSVVMHLTAAGRSHLAGNAHRAVAAKLKVSLNGGTTTMHAVSAS
jgi:hypothetical protein